MKVRGDPGIIIEAYSCGKPVITTNWKQIPEIVEDGRTGYLIQPRSVSAIKQAVERFEPDNYDLFCQNAYKKFADFDSHNITKKIIKILEQ